MEIYIIQWSECDGSAGVVDETYYTDYSKAVDKAREMTKLGYPLICYEVIKLEKANQEKK